MRHVIPNTNVCISATLKDGGAFAGVPVTSLNCYGTNHRIPRVTSNISVDTHFRNRCFVRFCCIMSLTEDLEPISTVTIISPINVGGTSVINTGCCLVFDVSVQTTIGLSTVTPSGYDFVGYYNDTSDFLGNGPTLNLTNNTVANSKYIYARFDVGGGT
jgi:hypothetical protein